MMEIDMDKITIERQTLQAALDALDKCARTLDEFPAWSVAGHEANLVHQSIANLRAALAAQPAPAAVPLTDEWVAAFSMDINGLSFAQVESIVRHVERAHGIAAAGDKP
jgi:uncharacterized membrane-anchored protein